MKKLNRRLFLKSVGLLAGASAVANTGEPFQSPGELIRHTYDDKDENPDGYIIPNELHVAVNGNDSDQGTLSAPFRTIQRAADVALPGDLVIVHKGIYRERINPLRGGESDTKRIVYQAAPDEKVEIRGSEIVKNWINIQENVWKVILPNSYFGCINPYSELISGGWFIPKDREHHTGAVYLNGEWLEEADGIDKVFEPMGSNPLWFAHVDRQKTTILAQFRGVNPNEQTVEINVRWAIFYPEKPGINYITVRGFTMRQAATQWAAPRAEQAGLIGTHWSKGWIIENNVISHSRCAGITLGKHGDEWDNNKKEGIFIEYARRAHANGWNKETIGNHIVRNNIISHCGQSGISGSLGAIFSKITGNEIHTIHVNQLFTGHEMAGIKLHAAIDTEISQNRIYNTDRGIWLDWMTQGTRVTGNLLYDNYRDDLFIEVSHGPIIADNNMFLSECSIADWSQGSAFIHNLITGYIISKPDKRITPYFLAHSTAIVGVSEIKGGDNHFYNNIFVGSGKIPGAVDKNSESNGKQGKEYGLCVYDKRELPIQTGGNVYLNGSKPYINELDALIMEEVDPDVKILEKGDQVFIQLNNPDDLKKAATRLISTKLLGQAKIPGLPYENPDGSPLTIYTDYFFNKRNRTKPAAGPIENPGTGSILIKVWEK